MTSRKLLTVEAERTLYAPVNRVWALITTLRYLQVWFSDIAAVQAISTAQTQAGTRFELLRRGQRDAEQWIVAEWEPEQYVRLTAYHRDVHLNFRLKAEGANTQLKLEHAYPNALGIVGRLLPPTRQKALLQVSLNRLHELITLNQDIKLLYGMGDE